MYTGRSSYTVSRDRKLCATYINNSSIGTSRRIHMQTRSVEHVLSHARVHHACVLSCAVIGLNAGFHQSRASVSLVSGIVVCLQQAEAAREFTVQ